MKRTFALAVALVALAAAALPATSMAEPSSMGMFPPNTKYEISHSGTAFASLRGSMPGACSIKKLTSTTPPVNSEGVSDPSHMPLTAPPAFTCGTGVSMTVASGEWYFTALPFYGFYLYGPPHGLTVRYASLPGCKLAVTPQVPGTWSTGYANRPSVYHAGGSIAATWENDGATCALAGKSDSFSAESVGGTNFYASGLVTDLANPSTEIVLFGGF